MSQLRKSPPGSIRSWHVDTEDRLRFHSVRIRYPEGLEEMISMFRISAANDPSVSNLVFTITEKAPTRAFSWSKAPKSAFTLKTLLKHYAKWALNPLTV